MIQTEKIVVEDVKAPLSARVEKALKSVGYQVNNRSIGDYDRWWTFDVYDSYLIIGVRKVGHLFFDQSSSSGVPTCRIECSSKDRKKVLDIAALLATFSEIKEVHVKVQYEA